MGGLEKRTFATGAVAVASLPLLPFFYALAIGAASIPHNDDWAFSRILFHLVETGDLRLVGWNEMVFVGHLVWAYPLAWAFPENTAVLNGAVALVSAVGVLLSAVLARRFLPTPYALAVALLVAVFPGHLQTTVSYMTDPVAFAVQLACILVGLAGIAPKDGNDRTLIALSLVIGLYGFSIREFSVLAPIAVCIGAIAADIRRRRAPYDMVIGLLLFLAAAGTIYVFRQSLPDGNSHTFDAPGLQRVIVLTAQSIFTVGLALTPVLLLYARSRRDALARCLNAGALIGIGLAVLALQHSADITTCCLGGRGSVFVGNALTERGVLGNQVLAGGRPVLFPNVYWVLLSALGIAGGSVGLGWVWSAVVGWFERGSDASPARLTLLAWGGLTGAAIIFRAALGGPLFDRYLTTVVIVAAIFALQGAPPLGRLRAPAGAIATTVLLAFTSVLLVTSGLSFDAARWRAGEAAVRQGVPAGAVDAGFEWVGSHYPGVTDEESPPITTRIGPGYMDMFPKAGNCVVVAASPQDNAELSLVDTIPYKVWFGARTAHLWVYRHEAACNAQGIG